MNTYFLSIYDHSTDEINVFMSSISNEIVRYIQSMKVNFNEYLERYTFKVTYSNFTFYETVCIKHKGEDVKVNSASVYFEHFKELIG